MLQTTFHLSERQNQTLRDWEKSLPVSRDPTAASYELFFKLDFCPALTSSSLPIASAKCLITGKTIELGSCSDKKDSDFCTEFFAGNEGEVYKTAFESFLKTFTHDVAVIFSERSGIDGDIQSVSVDMTDYESF